MTFSHRHYITYSHTCTSDTAHKCYTPQADTGHTATAPDLTQQIPTPHPVTLSAHVLPPLVARNLLEPPGASSPPAGALGSWLFSHPRNSRVVFGRAWSSGRAWPGGKIQRELEDWGGRGRVHFEGGEIDAETWGWRNSPHLASSEWGCQHLGIASRTSHLHRSKVPLSPHWGVQNRLSVTPACPFSGD